MPKIKVLDETTACRIAAGEVVERPVSVVKELLENSLDAGADQLTVILAGGGADSITVIDNGCGISQEDTPLAFQRHATSKISTAEDLDHIATMGFRGEALPSIAAVSDLQIRTRTAQRDEGYFLHIRGGAIIESGPVGCPVGTAVSVKELFFNTPARRKHLKTKATEGGLCADLIYKLSLINPGVRFTLEQQGRTLFRSPGTGKLSDVLAAVYGLESAGMLLPVKAIEGDMAVTGYVSKPELNRAGRQQITLAVNGRLVRSALVNQTLDEAYKGLMTVGRHPVAVLQIQLPTDLIDVNIHPAKTEIKIANELQLARLLVSAVRNALGKTSLIPSARPAPPAKTSLPAGVEPLKFSFASGAELSPEPSHELSSEPIDELIDEPSTEPSAESSAESSAEPGAELNDELIDEPCAEPSGRLGSARPGYDVRELAGYVAEAGAEIAGVGDMAPASDLVAKDVPPPGAAKTIASAAGGQREQP
ncbi:MAG: DNA mismatch repair endonuclease MutL, partial [Firmicutes bacterium]|nr:DNA mismatch repair endonuclease MutL [Bacillota bacterium]